MVRILHRPVVVVPFSPPPLPYLKFPFCRFSHLFFLIQMFVDLSVQFNLRMLCYVMLCCLQWNICLISWKLWASVRCLSISCYSFRISNYECFSFFDIKCIFSWIFSHFISFYFLNGRDFGTFRQNFAPLFSWGKNYEWTFYFHLINQFPSN